MMSSEVMETIVAPVISFPLVKSPLTLIIATYNRAQNLKALVEQIRRQPFIDWTLWVVDQSDPDDYEVNRLYFQNSGDPRLNYIHIDRKSLPNARNEGLARTKSEFVLFVDDDIVLLADDFLGAHIRAYTDSSIGGVTGRHVERLVRMNAPQTACYVSWGGRTVFNLFGSERQEIGSCKGSNMSFRMAAVQQVGGFDRCTNLLEDTDYSVRIRQAGWRLMFEPEAEILHLSTPAGGVREVDPLATECARFRSTAYYILKHRGWTGVPGFLATFTLIAVSRAVRFRSLSTLFTLAQAIQSGFSEARNGPDQSIAST